MEIEKNQTTRMYYKYLGVSFTIWSLNVPITAILVLLLAPWYRYQVVVIVDNVSRFLGQLLLSHLLCGPLSPITDENAFPARDVVDLTDVGFDKLDDGCEADPL